MKALIIGTDFLKDSEGNLKIIETNTNVDIHNEIVPELDWVLFKQFLMDNSINNLHFIHTIGNEIQNQNVIDHINGTIPNISMEDKMSEIMTELNGTFESHLLPKNSITVPYIEDNDNTLIIRTSYDVTAMVDEEYTKDKVNFHRLISNESYSTNFYYSSSVDTHLNADQLTNLHITIGDTPNYIVKTRLPHIGHEVYPKFYKIESLEDLQTLKNSVTNLEFIEEYHTNSENFVNEKIGVIRSLDILYGGNLSCLHLGSYIMTAGIKNNQLETTYGENGLMNEESRILWMTKNADPILHSNKYILDDDTPLLYPGNILKFPNELVVGDTIKTIRFPWVPDDDGTAENPTWQPNISSGSFIEDVATFTTGSTELIHMINATRKTVMIRVTLENGIVYEDLPTSTLYVEEYDTLRTTFSDTNTFRVNDSIIFYDYNNETLVKSKITDLEIVYVNRKVYDIDVEPSDVFLTLADSTLGLMFVQHNNCFGWCNVQAGDCVNNAWACSGCAGCGPQSYLKD
jgi:hypothetical protein